MDYQHRNFNTSYPANGPTYPTYDPYSSPPSPPKQEHEDQASLAAAQRNANSACRVVGRTLLVGMLIICPLVGMIIALIAYLCVGNKCTISQTMLVSTAPLGRVLTVSQVASHVAPLTVPLVMILYSHDLGARWLKSSTHDGQDRPSPLQLSLLLKLCSGANIPSLISSLQYFFGFGRQAKQQTLSSPPILHRSAICLFLLLLMAYIITSADVWLHVSSKAIVIQSIHPYTSRTGESLQSLFGRGVNKTKCDDAQDSLSDFFRASCGQINGGSTGNGRARMEGLRVLSNSSNLHQVVFTDDQTAIMVPWLISPNITYVAPTVGVKATCKSITKDCLVPQGSTDYGPNAFLNINCSRSGVDFNATYPFDQMALDEQGNPVSGYAIPSNPFHVGAVVTSQAYYGDVVINDDFVPNTGWFIHGNNGAWNVVYCNVTALDVLYAYESSSARFTLKKSTPASLSDARAMVTFGFEPWPSGSTWVRDAVDGAGLQTNTSYEAAYALELSRQTLARSAVMYENRPVVEINRELQIIGTKLNMVPFVMMLAAILSYCSFVAFILFQVVIATWRVAYVQLASAHLTDPLTAIHALYGPRDAIYTWQNETLKKFGVETEMDRLRIGSVVDEQTGLVRFGASKAFSKETVTEALLSTVHMRT